MRIPFSSNPFLTYRARNWSNCPKFTKMSQCAFLALVLIWLSIVKVIRSVRTRELLSKSCSNRAVIAGWTQSTRIRFSSRAIASFWTICTLLGSIKIGTVWIWTRRTRILRWRRCTYMGKTWRPLNEITLLFYFKYSYCTCQHVEIAGKR